MISSVIQIHWQLYLGDPNASWKESFPGEGSEWWIPKDGDTAALKGQLQVHLGGDGVGMEPWGPLEVEAPGCTGVYPDP